jgi:DinB superfamily
MDADSALREQLVSLLEGGNAHVKFEEAVKDFPHEKAGVRPTGLPHSAWELLEHIRLAQEDILRFSQSDEWESPKWPDGYWPKSKEPAGPKDWDNSIRSIRKDLAEFIAMVRDPKQDLNRKMSWGDGQTILREALLIADHNAYHLGQLVLVRKALDAWNG